MLTKKTARIAFMGTPHLAAVTLEYLIQHDFNIVAVIAQADKPVGREGAVEEVPTKVVAKRYGIPVFQPLKIKTEYDFLKPLHLDLIITLAYGQIVPLEVLSAPKLGCLNLHGSLLPALRGASPIRFALIEGLKTTGMTLMEMVLAMDAGKMYLKKEWPIAPEDNYTSLLAKFILHTPSFAAEALELFLAGKLKGIPQDEKAVTFAPLIKPEMEHLQLALPKQSFVNWVRGLSEEPGGYLLLGELKFKLYQAHVVNDQVSAAIGTIVKADKDGFWLQLRDGQIALEDVQLQGKKRMNYRSFLNGYPMLGKTLQ